jgi:hypothetical protein
MSETTAVNKTKTVDETKEVVKTTAVDETKTVDKTKAVDETTTQVFDYKKHGSDWPDLKIENNKCGSSMQSPIDLPIKVPLKNYFYAMGDQFNQIYNNIKNTEIEWDGSTSVV